MARLASPNEVNNAFYSELGRQWYEAYDHPVALLRAESRLRNPWIAHEIRARLGEGPREVLDVGCGGGFLSNDLAMRGHRVTGVDLSDESLAVAARHDRTARVRYLRADAMKLPFPDDSFEVVCAMDVLEHVERPSRLIAEASRVLRPGGLFFFHTFNRNRLSKWLVIRLVEYLVKNTPSDMHIHRLFIRPEELLGHCAAAGLRIAELRGVRPRFHCRGFWKGLLARTVPEDFSFTFTRSLRLGYSGLALKPPPAPMAGR